MAKKHKTTKKHRFKYTEPTGLNATQASAAPAVPATTAGSAKLASVAAASAVAAGRDFSYVGTDLRRLASLMVGLVALEAVLWYLLNHTGVGDVVFNLIQV